MNFNLTCSKTHILAWANSDNTLSLKINGVKYLGFPRIDKRGAQYWKCDTTLNNAQEEEPSKLTLKEEIALILKKPLSQHSLKDREKWAQWKAQENKDANNEPTSPN